MNDLRGFWVRKDKNVQVRVHNQYADDNGNITAVMVCFKNGHVKHMKIKQFLEEFISLEDVKVGRKCNKGQA